MAYLKRFVVIGDTGAGKSSFINACFNYCYGTRDASCVFDSDEPNIKLAIPCQGWQDRLDHVHGPNRSSERNITDQTKSQTMDCITYTLKFKNGCILELIDTPGFNDTDGTTNDESNIKHIEQALRAVSEISGLIIVVNGSIPRIGVAFRHFLRLLHDVWPNSLMNNVCAILTNCDELGCNMKPEILQTTLNVTDRTTFYIQNSIFRWDRKNRTSKSLRILRREFEDTIDTLTGLLPILFSFENVSTSAFEVGAIKQILIEKCIRASIDKMVESLRIRRLQRIASAGIRGAQKTMSENSNWEKHREITTFKWMEVEPSVPLLGSHLDNKTGQYSSTSLEVKPSQFAKVDDAAWPNGTRSETSSTHPHCSGISSKQSCFRRLLSFGTKEKQSARSHLDSSSKRPSAYTSDLTNSQLTTGSGTISNDNSDRSRTRSGQLPSKRASSVDCHYSHRHNQTNPSTFMNTFNHSNYPTRTKYRAQESKIQVTLPDNEAISHHEVAREQATVLRNEDDELKYRQDELRAEMSSLLDKLTSDVQEMRTINDHIDLLEKNKNVLNEFRNEIKLAGDIPEILKYYDETVRILSVQSRNRGDPTKMAYGNGAT